ncbi:hypothetical protein EB810_14190 [Altererythrobacter sp. FM1]|nr:hypothetical protein EB810_14190 [Altererythrobacter sp. FM1]
MGGKRDCPQYRTEKRQYLFTCRMCDQYLLMLITDQLLSQLSLDQLRQRDCAGFFGWPERHRLLQDLLPNSGARRSRFAIGRLVSGRSL